MYKLATNSIIRLKKKERDLPTQQHDYVQNYSIDKLDNVRKVVTIFKDCYVQTSKM